MRLTQPLVIIGLLVLALPVAAAAPDVQVRSDQPELSIDRQRYHLLTRLGPARLRVRGPGTLALLVRVNLPPAGEEEPPAVVLRLARLDEGGEVELARWSIREPPDEGRAYAETERYRPSTEAVVMTDLPAGRVVLSLTLAEEAPLGAVFAARFYPTPRPDDGAAAEPGADSEAQVPAAAGPAVPPARPGLVPRLGLAAPLVASGGILAVAGASLRLPLDSGWRLDVSVDALSHRLEGVAPGAAGVGPPSEVEVGYEALPVRVGAGLRWPLPDAQPFAGVGVGVTLGREEVAALRGAIEDEQTFLLLAAEARLGLEWAPAPGVGPLVVAARGLLHPLLLAGAPYGDPLPLSLVVLEVGYHVDW